MMPIRSRRPRQSSRSEPNPSAILEYATRLMNDWPKSWQIGEDDLRYGQQLLEEFRPFVVYLIEEKHLARKTIRRHLTIEKLQKLKRTLDEQGGASG